jgi:hypothetical protein
MSRIGMVLSSADESPRNRVSAAGMAVILVSLMEV